MNVKTFDTLTKGDFENRSVLDEIRKSLERMEELQDVLNEVDELLARRSALDSELTRYGKILKVINTAKRVDFLERKD